MPRESNGIDLPDPETRLRGSYPNPFEKQGSIEYVLNNKQSVTTEICTVPGQHARTLVNDTKDQETVLMFGL